MKRFIRSKKGLALLATMVIVGASAFGAYAYFTNTGTTNGTPVAVGTQAPAMSVQLNENLSGAGGTLASGISTTYTHSNLALLPTAIGDSNADVATVPFTISNESEAAELLTSYTITIENADNSAWFHCNDGTTATQLAANSGACNDTSTPCTAADFSINPANPVANGINDSPVMVTLGTADDLKPLSDAPANSYAASFTVQLVDNNANQDNCESQSPPITVSATS